MKCLNKKIDVTKGYKKQSFSLMKKLFIIMTVN